MHIAVTHPVFSDPAQAGAEAPFLHRIRLRARRRVLWLRYLWTNGGIVPEQGLAIAHSEVDRILTPPEEMARAEAAFYADHVEAQLLGREIEATDRQAEREPLWEHLRQAFTLSRPESDLLALIVAAEMDPALRRVYGYLHDDVNACWPSPWLASSLFGWPADAHIGAESMLARWRLAYPVEGASHPWSQTAPWTVDPSITAWLLGASENDPILDGKVERLSRESLEGVECLFPSLLREILEFLQTMRAASGAPVEIELIGPAGAGKQTLATQAAAKLRADLIAADAGALLGSDVPLALAEDRTVRVSRAARLSEAQIYWQNAGRANPRVWEVARQYADVLFLGSEAPLTDRPASGVVRRAFRLPRLTRAMRRALWQRLSALTVPVPVADWALTPGEIASAAQVAPAGPAAVVEVCWQRIHQEPGELFAPLICPYTWDDIVVAPGVRRHLADFEAQARLRGPVYDEWGFERLCPLGRGISALFAGPSGTGKTMAAQVIARSLDMELYRVDLSGVMNKYIGETEKRLKQVFDACERANVLLFFDEADALFGQRTQVKDAHDRFANIEIDYLLQRMEQYDGIAILATNRKSDLDPAFLRRIRFIVEFVPPGPAERSRLWRLALPERAPGGAELLGRLDWEFLADRLDMTGAEIKNSALSAAFLARAEGARIDMNHILTAARRELAKRGLIIRPGEWENSAWQTSG